MTKGDPLPADVLVETIVFYVFALLLFVGRIWSRKITTGSLRQLGTDDYVMVVTFLFYTALMVLLNFNVRYASNLMDPSELPAVLADPEEVKSRIFGSKITVAVEQCMIHAQWGTKASLLLLYHRMTAGLRENIWNKALAAYVAFGYVFIQITFFFVWCRPFDQYWALPPDNAQCSSYSNYCITILVFNTSSDLFMLIIPIQLIWRAQMKRKKKYMLCAVFSLGLFNIVAAVLNKTYNWILPGSIVYMIWYVREASTGIYVANVTCCWPLLRKFLVITGLGGSWTNSQSRRSKGVSKYMYDQYGNQVSCAPPHGGDGSDLKSNNKRASLAAARHSRRVSHKLRSMRDRTLHSLHSTAADGRNASEEAITGAGAGDMRLEIWRQVEYDIEHNQPPTPSLYEEAYGAKEGAAKGDLPLGLRNDVTATVTEVKGGVHAMEEGRAGYTGESGHAGRKGSKGSRGSRGSNGGSGSGSHSDSRTSTM